MDFIIMSAVELVYLLFDLIPGSKWNLAFKINNNRHLFTQCLLIFGIFSLTSMPLMSTSVILVTLGSLLTGIQLEQLQ